MGNSNCRWTQCFPKSLLNRRRSSNDDRVHMSFDSFDILIVEIMAISLHLTENLFGSNHDVFGFTSLPWHAVNPFCERVFPTNWSRFWQFCEIVGMNTACEDRRKSKKNCQECKSHLKSPRAMYIGMLWLSGTISPCMIWQQNRARVFSTAWPPLAILHTGTSRAGGQAVAMQFDSHDSLHPHR